MTVVSATAWIRMTACFRFGCCTFSWVCLVRSISSSCRRVVCLLILGLCAVNKSHSPLCCKPPQAKFSMQWVLVRFKKVEWGWAWGEEVLDFGNTHSRKSDSVCSACSKEVGVIGLERLIEVHTVRQRGEIVSNLLFLLCLPSDCNRGLVAFREDSWFKSLFVRKVDPRKDAHSHLLAKKEDNNLYKIQCWYRSSCLYQCYNATLELWLFTLFIRVQMFVALLKHFARKSLMVYFFFLLVSVQFTMSSQSALMPTMNFGEICLFKKPK